MKTKRNNYTSQSRTTSCQFKQQQCHPEFISGSKKPQPSLEFLSSTLPLLGDTSSSRRGTSLARLRACERSESLDVAQRQERVSLRNSFLSQGEIGKKAAFTKPSRATSEARVERASTETLSGLRAEAEVVLVEAFASKAKTRNAVEGEQPSGFRCKRERWRLMRGAVSTLNTRAAFTLAEVLITLAIIGVVAAMTIPTLIAKINSIVTDNQIKVFNAKLIKGMNLTKTAGDLNNTYESTYDFLVNGLGKNLKMAKICDSSHIRDCIPYDKVKYDKNGTEEALDVKDLKTAGDLQINNTNGTRFTDTAAFVLADGTPVIVTYDLNCIDDPDKADTTINKCLAGIYDLNGTRKPNKYGESEVNGKTTHNSDLQPFNGARIANSALAILGGVKIMTAPTIPTPIKTSDLCDTSSHFPDYWKAKPEYAQYDINNCLENKDSNDYWAGAMIMCKKQGMRLPTVAEVTAMASELYNTSVAESGRTDAVLDTSKIPSALSGLGSSFSLWSNSGATGVSNYRYFGNSYTIGSRNSRSASDVSTFCVAD